MDNILEFVNVNFTWANTLTFSDLAFGVERGSFNIISGPSGSGKSTLLRLISRLEDIKSGTIIYDGKPIEKYLPTTYRQQVTLIQQTPTVLNGSVKENLMLPFSFAVNKNMKKPTDELLQEKLNELSLNIDLDKDATTLSVGQKQRLCIIRSLLLQPKVLLMDEPTSALDIESKEIVENITEKLNDDGVTILMISHSTYAPNRAFSSIIVKDSRVQKS